MKKYGYKFFLLFIPLFCFAEGASVTVAWDPNSETDIAGYKVHWSTKTRQEQPKYEHIVDAGNVTFVSVKDLPYETKIYIAATAYNTEGLESLYSNEITYTTGPFIPGTPASPTIQNLRMTKTAADTTVSVDLIGGVAGKTYTLQSSDDLENWIDETVVTVLSSNELKTIQLIWPKEETPSKMFFRFKWQK